MPEKWQLSNGMVAVMFRIMHLNEENERGYLSLYDNLTTNDPRKRYLTMISVMDEGVGKVLKLLDSLDLIKNTIILFLSDNGPVSFYGGSSGSFRGNKHSLYEGGIPGFFAIQ